MIRLELLCSFLFYFYFFVYDKFLADVLGQEQSEKKEKEKIICNNWFSFDV